MTFFPTDPKKIRDRIRRYERALREKHHDDGGGKRFLLGPLYLMMGDLEGAMSSYRWYKRKFPEDMPETFNYLCWVLTLLRHGNETEAKKKFRELVFSNLYAVPVMLDLNPAQHPFRHYSNWSELSYVQEGPWREILALWQPAELEWLKEQWNNPSLQDDLNHYIKMHQQLDATKNQTERKRILSRVRAIETGTKLRLVAESPNE